MKRKQKRKEIDRLHRRVQEFLATVEDRIDFLIENKDFLVEVPDESGRAYTHRSNYPVLEDLMENAQFWLFWLEYLENCKAELE